MKRYRSVTSERKVKEIARKVNAIWNSILLIIIFSLTAVYVFLDNETIEETKSATEQLEQREDEVAQIGHMAREEEMAEQKARIKIMLEPWDYPMPLERPDVETVKEREEKTNNLTEDVSESTLLWLQKITFAEARGESQEGQIAVVNVIFNRVDSSEFPNTVYQVIFDDKYAKQFEPTKDGDIWFIDENGKERFVTESDITDMVKESVDIALSGENVIGDRMYFHRVNGDEASHKDSIVIGNHVFY